MFVFIRKNTNIFEKQRHLCIFLEFHKTIMQQLESHQKDFPILSLTIKKRKKHLRTNVHKCFFVAGPGYDPGTSGL